MDYKQAGVDIQKGDQLVKRIAPWAAQSQVPGVITGVGGFGSIFDPQAAGYQDALIVCTTDGVGTKLLLAKQTNIWKHVGQDLVAMCVNDLLAQGAEPQLFLDYYATGKLDVEAAAEILQSIAQACQMAGCALVGGETAELPGMYGAGDIDLAGFAVGLVERPHVLPRNIQPGDVILGLASSGFHSNGFSLIRKILADWHLDAECPWDPSMSLGQVLMTPTKIYTKSVVPLVKQQLLKGCAHITGGGLANNVSRIIPDHLHTIMQPEIPQPFLWMQQQGNISDQELRQVFNCGVGMVLVVDPQNVCVVQQALEQTGETVQTLGRVINK